MIVIHQITKDLVWRGVEPRIDAVQGDASTRMVEITLTAEGVLWTPPPDAKVLIGYARPDGCGGQYDTTPDGNIAYSITGSTVSIVLAPQALAVPGVTTVQVNLISENMVLGIFPFRVNIARDPAIGTVPAETYINCQALAELVTKVEDLENRETESAEIPAFDLAALGLPTIPMTGQMATAMCDTTEIRAALAKGLVAFTINIDMGGQPVPIVFPMAGALSEGNYACTYTTDALGAAYYVTIIVADGALVATIKPLAAYIDAYMEEALGGDY